MSVGGFVLVEYRHGSAHPQLAGKTIFDDVEVAEEQRREVQKDKIAARQQHRVEVARLDVIER
jgi:hypothetical protein